jgi:hypothetical protein
MPRLNWLRFFLGALIASVIMFMTDGFLHERVFTADWASVYANLGVAEPHHEAAGILYFAIFEIGRGFVSMFLYVLMQSFFGPGPKTAILAGVVGWIAFSLTGPTQFIPLGFYSNALWVKVAAAQLVTSIVATIAGAALYKDL